MRANRQVAGRLAVPSQPSFLWFVDTSTGTVASLLFTCASTACWTADAGSNILEFGKPVLHAPGCQNQISDLSKAWLNLVETC